VHAYVIVLASGEGVTANPSSLPPPRRLRRSIIASRSGGSKKMTEGREAIIYVTRWALEEGWKGVFIFCFYSG